MAKYEVIDTFPGFLAFWHKAQRNPVDAQIEGWAAEYMSQWPELLEKQLDDYARQNMDWHQVVKERVFPFLSDRLTAMESAHKNLLELCGSVYSMAQGKLGFESDLVFVIYVGIGCGAGWATTFEDKPAILFGLENIAECGWSDAKSLAGLIAHEIGHLVHKIWRREGGLIKSSGPWWQLFSEGFAQRCEHEILGKESWHVSMGISRSEWLQWCRERTSWLAGEFLRRVDAGESVRPFFGSWLDVQGKKHTGHFLGHELVKELEQGRTLKEIALLDDIPNHARCILKDVDISSASGGVTLYRATMNRLYDEPKYYEIAFSFRDISHEVDVFEECIRNFSRIPVKSVLELGCGNCPHMEEFVKRGYEYTGLDISDTMLKYSREKASRLHGKICLVRANMVDFHLTTPFDFAYVTLGSLYVKSKVELISHFSSVSRSVKKGALYFLEWCVQFEPLSKRQESWETEREGIRVKTTVCHKCISSAEQLFEESILLDVDDNGTKKIIEQKSVKRAIYPREFLSLVKSLEHFEFVGWWNEWDSEQPVEKAEKINRPITIVRKKQ